MSDVQDKANVIADTATAIVNISAHTDTTSDQYVSVLDELTIAEELLEHALGRLIDISPIGIG